LGLAANRLQELEKDNAHLKEQLELALESDHSSSYGNPLEVDHNDMEEIRDMFASKTKTTINTQHLLQLAQQNTTNSDQLVDGSRKIRSAFSISFDNNLLSQSLRDKINLEAMKLDIKLVNQDSIVVRTRNLVDCAVQSEPVQGVIVGDMAECKKHRDLLAVLLNFIRISGSKQHSLESLASLVSDSDHEIQD